MGIRIHRAIGWGLEWNRFEELTTLGCEAHETDDALRAAFDNARPEDLVVPMSIRDQAFYAGPGPRRSIMIDNNLLALDFEFDDTETEADEDGKERRKRIPPKLARPDDLFTTVSDPDNTQAVMFFPNASEAKRWYRFDDMLDYQFEALRDGRDGDPTPREIIEWPKFGHYPYSNHLMDPRDGSPLAWDVFWRLDETYPDGWAPDVPSEIRWYLPKLGVLDDAGVNQLRPILAQWWC